MNQKPTPEQYIQMLQKQNGYLAHVLTALIKKFGKEQVIYAAGKAPCIELELTKEELAMANGQYHCEQEPKDGGVILKLVKTPQAGKQH
jgi:hypothetical protein